MRLDGPMQPPQSGGAPKYLVVLLHGYGSDGNDLIGLAPHLADAMPEALFVSPNAPDPVPGNPFGHQWFAIDFTGDRVSARQSGIAAAQPVLATYLAELWAETGLTAADTVLVGFSQGAMMALHVGLSLDAPLLGIIAFAGALVAPAGFDAPEHYRVPICLVHGDLDRTLVPSLSADAETRLTAAGYPVERYVARGVAHGISPDGLAFAQTFLRGLLTSKAEQ